MSRHAMDSVLYRLANQPEAADAFRSDPESFLGAFNLDDAERAVLREMNVEDMAAIPLNWMLMLGAFQAVRGRAGRAEYLQRVGAFMSGRA